MALNDLYQTYDALIIVACLGSILLTTVAMAVLSYIYYARRNKEKE